MSVTNPQLIAIRIAERVGPHPKYMDMLITITRKILRRAMSLMIRGTKEKKPLMTNSEFHFKVKEHFITYVPYPR